MHRFMYFGARLSKLKQEKFVLRRWGNNEFAT